MHFLDSKNWYKKYTEIEEDSSGIEIHHVYIESWWYKWIHINPWHCYLLTWHHFKEIRKQFQPTILHSNFVGVCSISTMWLARKYQLKFVITEHWTRVHQYMRHNKLSFLGKKAYNNADAITVVSHFLGEVVGNYVHDKGKIIQIPNVIDPSIFSFRPKETTRELIFTFVGHLKLPKLPLLVVHVVNKIAKERKEKITLFLFGEGPLEQTIRSMMPSLSFEVRLMGLRPKKEVAEALQKSTLYLHASTYETFCVAIAEALSTGTPVVASDTTAIPELIHHSNGVLAKNEEQEWADAISKALTLDFHHSAIAFSVHNRYSYPAIGKHFADLYATL